MALYSSAPQVNEQRLWNNIMETSTFGSHSSIPGGMSRLSLSDDDKSVRHWFITKARILGCEVRVDEMGNIFAIWHGNSGIKSKYDPIGMGSHLDTQPIGMFFDNFCLDK